MQASRPGNVDLALAYTLDVLNIYPIACKVLKQVPDMARLIPRLKPHVGRG